MRIVQKPELHGGYLFPHEKGCIYKGRQYSEHALERMAPNSPEIIELLMSRAFKRMDRKVLDIKMLLESGRAESEDFLHWWKDYTPEPRGYTPLQVELWISVGDPCVKLSDHGGVVITVTPNEEEHFDQELVEKIHGRLKKKAKQLEHSRSLRLCQQEFSYHSWVDERIILTHLVVGPNKDRRMPSTPLDIDREEFIAKKNRKAREQSVVLNNDVKSWEENRKKQQQKTQEKRKTDFVAKYKTLQTQKTVKTTAATTLKGGKTQRVQQRNLSIVAANDKKCFSFSDELVRLEAVQTEGFPSQTERQVVLESCQSNENAASLIPEDWEELLEG
jgi:hypothetical protein